MRLGILLLALIAVIFGSGYWYSVIDTTCNVPVSYRIGSIDERFGTDEEELKRIVKNAELIWESRLGKELFIYSPDGELPINLVFDERQQNANLEEDLRKDIEIKEGMSADVATQYEKLIAKFYSLKQDYEAQVIVYERQLNEYNTTITEWNESGGVPQEEIDTLKHKQNELEQKQEELETRAKELNVIADRLNTIGSHGNSLITDYNKIVEKYNTRFSEIHEYTQGDHSVEAINVYQFNTEEELILVLAHELGHALSLGHVTNEESIMHQNMGGQQIVLGLSTEDVFEFNEVCTEKNGPLKLIALFENIF